MGLPLTLTIALTTGQHYRAACGLNVWRIFTVAGIGNFLVFCEK